MAGVKDKEIRLDEVGRRRLLRTLAATGLPMSWQPDGSALNRESLQALMRQHGILERRGTVSLCATEKRTTPGHEDDGVLGWRRVDDGRLQFNVNRFSQAAEQLGVHWPVTVTWVPGLQGRQPGEDVDGVHQGSRAERCHTIEIRAGLSADRAEAVLWHELAHARQAEVFGSVQELRDLIGEERTEEDAWERWKHIRLPMVVM